MLTDHFGILALSTPVVGDYFAFFGAVSVVLGFLGWKKAGSKASLIAGGISGLLLLLGTVLILTGKATAGLGLGTAVSFLLLGRFAPAAMKTKALYPAGIMALLALVGLILGILALT